MALAHEAWNSRSTEGRHCEWVLRCVCERHDLDMIEVCVSGAPGRRWNAELDRGIRGLPWSRERVHGFYE